MHGKHRNHRVGRVFDVVQAWAARRADHHVLGSLKHTGSSASGRRLIERALAEHAGDPFQGSRERRIHPEHRPCSDMELRACQDALDRARVHPRDIDFVLGFSMIPDHLTVPNACVVHERLGLRPDCLTLATGASFNAFAAQMTLAHGLITGRGFRCGLLFQSNALGRLIPADAPYAPWFGDAATAVVVAPVRAGRGLLATSHYTDGSLFQAMVAGVPGRAWYDDGRVLWHPGVPEEGPSSLLLGVADRARHVLHGALERAEILAEQVSFYAAHQAAAWLRRVTQEHAGLQSARALDTFPWAASVGAANVPLVLHTARRSGFLRDDDIVATFTGGLGATWSAMILRWGS
jgi:3-oxoacyl-[acyl-carrier-protein] synthase-3